MGQFQQSVSQGGGEDHKESCVGSSRDPVWPEAQLPREEAAPAPFSYGAPPALLPQAGAR